MWVSQGHAHPHPPPAREHGTDVYLLPAVRSSRPACRGLHRDRLLAAQPSRSVARAVWWALAPKPAFAALDAAFVD
jgi:hypothetical protein